MNALAPVLPPILPHELRQVLGAFVTGVTVVTTLDSEGAPHGLTANSFSSVSLDPPLILWSQALSAYSHPVFRDAERFVVNILADDQIEVSNRFAKAGEDKFGRTAVSSGLAGLPLIQGCAAYLECRRVAGHPAGDHMIFIGEVERIERTGRRPLAFGGGRYLIAHAHDFGVASTAQDASNRSRLQAVRLATHAAVELSAQLDETVGVAVWGNQGPTIVHWELGSRPVSVALRVGAVLPLLGSATGLVFGAWLPRAMTRAFVEAEAGQAPPVGLPGDDPDRSLDERLVAIRRAGHCAASFTASFSDRSDVPVNVLSARVFDGEGQILLALTVLGHGQALAIDDQAPVAQALKACAAGLSRHGA